MVFGANSYVCRSYSGKTSRDGLFVGPQSWIGLIMSDQTTELQVSDNYPIIVDYKYPVITQIDYSQLHVMQSIWIQTLIKTTICTTSRAGIYLLKVSNRGTRTRGEICSKLTIKTVRYFQKQWDILGINPFMHNVAKWPNII